MESNNETSITTTPYPKVPLPILRVSNVISVAAILLNVIHILFLSLRPKSNRPKAENFKVFLIYLAVVDILMMIGQFALDHDVIQMMVYRNHWACVLNATILHSLFVFELVLLLLMSMERLLTVWLPNRINTAMHKKTYAIFIFSLYVSIQFLYCALAILFHDKAYAVKGSGVCSPGSKEMPELNNVSIGFGLICLTLIVLSSLILLGKSCHIISMANTLPDAARTRRARQTIVITYMIGALVTAKVICWLPVFIAVILRNTRYHSPNLDYIGRMMVHVFSFLAPLIYGVSNKQYRQYIMRTLSSISISVQVAPIQTGRTSPNTSAHSKPSNHLQVITPRPRLDTI